MSDLIVRLLDVKDMKEAWKRKPVKTALLALSFAAVFALAIFIGFLISKALPSGISRFLFDSDSTLSLVVSGVFWLILIGVIFLLYFFILEIIVDFKNKRNQ